MKKNSLLWSLAAASMMFFASCENNDGPNVIDSGKDATVKVSVLTQTRAITGNEGGSDGENKINYLEAYTFNHSNGTLIDYSEIVDVRTISSKEVTLKAEIGKVIIAVVANTTPTKKIGEVNNLTTLKGKLSTFTFTVGNNNIPPSDGFVMSAIDDNVIINEGTNQESISLRRTVSKFIAPNFDDADLDLSKIDLAVLKTVFPTFTAEDDVEDIKFDYISFALANGLNKSKLFNDANYENAGSWPTARGTWIADIASDVSLTYIKSNFVNKQYSPDPGGVYSNSFITSKTAPVYVHENFPYADFTPEGSTVVGYNPKEVYCFIVKGTLTWSQGVGEDAKPKTRYWRINLVKTTTTKTEGEVDYDYYKVFRNGSYKVYVDEIKTIGHGTPQEAEEEVPVIPKKDDALITIKVDVEKWDIYESYTNV